MVFGISIAELEAAVTDEARMEDDGCTQELSDYLPVTRPLTREELEAAIDQYGFAMAIVGKWGGRHKDERAWQEMLAAKADAERTIAVLLDWIPWGDA